MILDLVAVLFYAAAAMLLFFFLVSRVILPLKAGIVKTALAIATFIVLMAAAVRAGYHLGFSAWAVLPALILVGTAADEWYAAKHRKRLKGAPPVETTDTRLSLRRPLTTTDLHVSRYDVRLPDWTGPDFRVVHISDFHVTERLPYDYYRGVVERAAAASPDLVFVTGDFLVTNTSLPALRDVLQGLSGRCGAFATLGNHDYWTGPDAIRDAVQEAGLDLVGNETRRVGIGGHSVLVSGCEDPWAPTSWEPPVAQEGEPLLVLSHTADNIYRISRAGAAAAFAGHYHDGQFKLPLIGALVIPSIYGRRFHHGHFVIGETHLFVSAGIGVAGPAHRVYCRPDLFVIDFRGRQGAG